MIVKKNWKEAVTHYVFQATIPVFAWQTEKIGTFFGTYPK
jgi:hypothetical protein